MWLFHCSKYVGEITSENYFVILNVFLCCISHSPPSSRLTFSYLDSPLSPPFSQCWPSLTLLFEFPVPKRKLFPHGSLYTCMFTSLPQTSLISGLKLMLICHTPLLPILAMSVPANKAQVLIHSF